MHMHKHKHKHMHKHKCPPKRAPAAARFDFSHTSHGHHPGRPSVGRQDKVVQPVRRGTGGTCVHLLYRPYTRRGTEVPHERRQAHARFAWLKGDPWHLVDTPHCPSVDCTDHKLGGGAAVIISASLVLEWTTHLRRGLAVDQGLMKTLPI